MSSRKPKRQNNHNQNQNQNQNQHHHQHFPHPSDYESDNLNPLYFPQMQHHQAQQAQQAQQDQQDQQDQQPIHPLPLRSNEELNLSVLRRHNPSINTILSLAPYAVVYIFSPATRQWEKSGVEGTMFVCQLVQGPLGEERYSIFVLNRRGLDNFDIPLTDGENVELTEEYVILKTDSNPELDTGGIINTTITPNTNGNNGTTRSVKGKNGDVRIYGLWIYSEPPPNSTAETRTINAQVIHECAVHAGQSLKLARERQEAARQNGLHLAAAATASTAAPVDEVQSSVPMGRQISLKDLFGQQRAQDDGWSVRAHSLAPMAPPPPMQPSQDVLGDLFRRAGLAYQGGQVGQGY